MSVRRTPGSTWIVVAGTIAACAARTADDVPVSVASTAGDTNAPAPDAAAEDATAAHDATVVDASVIDTDMDAGGDSDGADGDAAPDADLSDVLDAGAPLVSTPLAIVCGAESCDASTDQCCVESTFVLATSSYTVTESCAARNECVSAVALDCDEQADCATGWACCGAFQQRQLGARCLPIGTCAINGAVQLCGQPDDCPSGVTCTAKKCNGQTFHSCGDLPAWEPCD